MMAGGVETRRRRAPTAVPAQSLVAVGIGVIYLSLYAAHAFYALVGAPVAFVAMALVTAAGFATALRLDSRALAVLATLGGLLTPVILDTDTDAAAALFTYLAILDLGVLLLASRRGWPGLALLAFAGTQVLYWGWLDRWYQADRLPVVARMGDACSSSRSRPGRSRGSRSAPARRHRRARAGADHPRGAGPLLRRRAARPGRPVGAAPGRSWRSPSRRRTSWRRAWRPGARAAAPGSRCSTARSRWRSWRWRPR